MENDLKSLPATLNQALCLEIREGILPTNSNIARHMPSWSMNCPICGHHEESDTHVLLECPLAVQV